MNAHTLSCPPPPQSPPLRYGAGVKGDRSHARFRLRRGEMEIPMGEKLKCRRRAPRGTQEKAKKQAAAGRENNQMYDKYSLVFGLKEDRWSRATGVTPPCCGNYSTFLLNSSDVLVSALDCCTAVVVGPHPGWNAGHTTWIGS